jgi:protein-S-isoprenylcysteine O-methyltransferase Ste14
MSGEVLRSTVRIVVLVVVGYEVLGAVRTFSPVKGEALNPRLQLLPIGYVIMFYRTFGPRVPAVWLAIPGLTFFVSSLALYEWARRSIAGKFFSYAYSDDTPDFLWTKGPFAYIRNPFYTSYLLTFAGTAILFPGILTGVLFVVMIAFFFRLVQHEERKFRRSAMASEYEDYMRRTGRFMPRTKRIRG